MVRIALVLLLLLILAPGHESYAADSQWTRASEYMPSIMEYEYDPAYDIRVGDARASSSTLFWTQLTSLLMEDGFQAKPLHGCSLLVGNAEVDLVAQLHCLTEATFPVLMPTGHSVWGQSLFSVSDPEGQENEQAARPHRFKDGEYATVSEVLDEAVRFLGKGYRETGENSGRFVSADGARVVRIKKEDILAPRPHANFERLESDPWSGKMRVIENIHVYLLDP